MPRFIAAHTLPWTETDINDMIAKGIPDLPPGVAWNATYCGFEDHKFFCDWEAPDKATVEQIFKAQNLPFEAIYQVRKFDVANKNLEP